jgi:uncharacterized protein with PIN domain
VNFLVDAQLPPELARWLADQGHSAQHVYNVGLARAEDFLIWNHALGVDGIIVTKDEDFAERNRTNGCWASDRLASNRKRYEPCPSRMAGTALVFCRSIAH